VEIITVSARVVKVDILAVVIRLAVIVLDFVVFCVAAVVADFGSDTGDCVAPRDPVVPWCVDVDWYAVDDILFEVC